MAPLVQYTDALPGGALDVHIYPSTAGQDASFVVVEDDGETVNYMKGLTREIALSWTDATQTLSWSVKSKFTGPQSFTHLRATLFLGTAGTKITEPQPIGTKGAIKI